MSRSGVRRAPGYAETNPRTLVGLQKVNVQLQKELDKLDRQAHTAVSNIANHQQAMKMSWRRLEAHRDLSNASPRARRAAERLPASPGPRRSLFSSNTLLYVNATPEVYGQRRDVEAAGKTEDDSVLPRTHSSYQLTSGHLPNTLRSSPYLSSPYMYRRSPLVKKQTDGPLMPSSASTTSPLTLPNATLPTSPSSSHSPPTRASADETHTKLPPIHPSSSQPSLVATTNKDTLLKMSAMMGLDSHSHGPKSFQSFYSTDRPPSHLGQHFPSTPALLLSPSAGVGEGEGGDGEKESDGEGEGGVETEERELSLAEMFEQIRHCRYIRHYHPDGTAAEDY